MAELSITVVPAKILADGTHKIRIAINHGNETRYIITRFKIDDLKQFKSGRVVGRTDASMMNKKLINILNDYYDMLDTINPVDFTCNQLKEYFESYNTTPPVVSLSDCWQKYIDNLNKEDRSGTAGLHTRTKLYFEEKFGSRVLLLTFSANTVNGFERYLFKERKLNSTTAGMHMKRLKVIINSAKKEGLVEYRIDPFAHYVLPEVQERELDIDIEEVRKIRDSKPAGKGQLVARDLFMLSYYLGGINLIDLLKLDFRKMKEISYIRTKTEHTKRGDKRISLTIPQEAKPIIQRWAGPDGKLNFGYQYSYDNFRKYVTHTLGTLAKSLGIDKRVVYYSARKSLVQHGFELNIPLETLEYTIGQSVKKNRPIFNYVRFMKSHADKAMREILDNLKSL